VLERLERIVVKPRAGGGGGGVQVLAVADRGERDDVAAMIRRDPDKFVAQDLVRLSTHPTLHRDVLEPRRVDLRPFLIAVRGGYQMVAAGLTRFAPSSQSMHVNSSRGGGAKDTWVVA
jgi:carboxylate-amine ligase